MNKVEYPEHEKFQAVKEKSQAIGAFIQWLDEKKHYLGIYTDIDETTCNTCNLLDSHDCPNDVILSELEEAIKKWGEHPDCYVAAFIRANYNINKLLAEYFEIDLDKLEEEKRQILDKQRELNKESD